MVKSLPPHLGSERRGGHQQNQSHYSHRTHRADELTAAFNELYRSEQILEVIVKTRTELDRVLEIVQSHLVHPNSVYD
jgi:N-acetyl-gamma-glutamylphosphate reductase